MRSLFLALALLVGACAGARQARPGPERAPHLGDDWFVHRAAELGMSTGAARARDSALAESQPPEGLEDDLRLGEEGALLWRALCADCHGADGVPPEKPELDPRPRAWGGFGVRMGFLFGGDSMRAGIYKRIADGGPEKDGKLSPMVAWRESLAREQIWALVRHIEGF